MATSAAGPLVANPGEDAAPAALPGVPSAPGWLALRHCPLGGNGPPVGLALLHPKIGVALVDFSPTPFDAADRLRRALDARRFPAVFGGYPPIVHVVVPADRLPDLGGVLSARFRAEPRFALEGDDAWMPTARAALEEAPPAAAPPSAAGKRDVPPRRAAALLLGAAAVGAAAAAVAVTAPPRGGHGDQRAPVAATSAVVAARPPEPAVVEPLPPPRPEPGRGQAAMPPQAAPRPEPDPRAGPDAAVAAPQEAGVERAPPSGATDGGEPEPPPPALAALAAAPVEPAPADAAEEHPWPVPRPAAERPPRTRVAAAAAAGPAGAADRKRCLDTLVKATLGGDLSDGDKQHMLRGCKRARN